MVISASNAALMFATRLGIKSWVFLPGKEVFFEGGDHTESLAMQNASHFYKNLAPSWGGRLSINFVSN